MNSIPSLYELACRAYSGMCIGGYLQAFDDALKFGERPGLIILRIRSRAPLIPYYDDDPYSPYIQNPFVWRIALIDHSRIIAGPQQTQYGHVGQIAVIEEEWYDDWEGDIDPPRLVVCRTYRLRGWNLPPTEAPIPREHQPRLLYPDEVICQMTNLCPPSVPLEAHWFEDAELPIQIIDGVPESALHSELRRRINIDHGDYHPLNCDRSYLEDPNWRRALERAYAECDHIFDSGPNESDEESITST